MSAAVPAVTDVVAVVDVAGAVASGESEAFRFFDKAGHKAFVAELARTVQVARSVLLPADEKALALHGHN